MDQDAEIAPDALSLQIPILPRVRPASDMHIEWVDDEAVVLDPDTGQIHYLNAQAALVYALILEHGYEKALIELNKAFGLDEVGDDLATLTADMISRGLLIDE